MNGKWFDDRRFVLTILTMAGSVLVMAAVQIWITSEWFARMDERVTRVENETAAVPRLEKQTAEALARIIAAEVALQVLPPLQKEVVEVRTLQNTVLPRLTRIEDKMDRVIDTLNGNIRRGQP